MRERIEPDMVRELFRTLIAAFKSWREDNASRLGAALAYYTVFSLPGLLLVLVAAAGVVFGRAAVEGRVMATLSGLIGAQTAAFLQHAMQASVSTHRGAIATSIGIVTLVLGGAGVFGSLQDALNTVWEVRPARKRGIWPFLQSRLFSLLTLLGTAFLLVMSLAVNMLVSAVGDRLARLLPGSTALWQGVNLVLALGVLSVLFALMFKFLPDVEVRWRDVWVGALLTAVLFTVGEWAIGFYLGRTNVGSAFGAAGSLVVVLTWLYYSSQIFLFGAEYTQAWARGHGGMAPSEDAVPVSEHRREQQGIPHRAA